MRLALVGNEHHHDEEDEQGSSCSDANDCCAAERAVRCDVDHTWGELDATHTCLMIMNDKKSDYNCCMHVRYINAQITSLKGFIEKGHMLVPRVDT